MEPTSRVVDAVDRLKGVFLELPGTQLTLAEAVRVSGLDTAMCEVVLRALEDAGFLTRRPGGFFIRRDGR
jgi:hypothetical protein